MVDWSAVDQAGVQRSGLPIEVAARAPGTPVASAAPSVPVSDTPTAPPMPLYPQDNATSNAPVTPIFGTLQPPPGMPAAPQDQGGNSFTPPDRVAPAPPQYSDDTASPPPAAEVPADEGVHDLRDLHARGAH